MRAKPPLRQVAEPKIEQGGRPRGHPSTVEGLERKGNSVLHCWAAPGGSLSAAGPCQSAALIAPVSGHLRQGGVGYLAERDDAGSIIHHAYAQDDYSIADVEVADLDRLLRGSRTGRFPAHGLPPNEFGRDGRGSTAGVQVAGDPQERRWELACKSCVNVRRCSQNVREFSETPGGCQGSKYGRMQPFFNLPGIGQPSSARD